MNRAPYKRPNAQPGTFDFWHLELYEFMQLCKVVEDIKNLDAAFRALGAVYARTEPEDKADETLLIAEMQSAVRLYEDTSLSLIGLRSDTTFETGETVR